MSKPKSSQVFIFAFIICLVCSVILAGASTLLQERQKANVRLDIVKNIMQSVGHKPEEFKGKKPNEIFAMYEKEFKDLLFDKNNQVADQHFMIEELVKLGYERHMLENEGPIELMNTFNSKVKLLAKRSNDPKSYDPGFKLVHIWQPNGTPEAYVIPIEGYGLWDIIKGYMALEPDLNTVKGITFFEHKETPGLGARIEEDWFKQQFIGKKILDDQGHLTSITVVRGKVAEQIQGDEAVHYVDGISGATLTGKGVNQFLRENLASYEPFFKTLRKDT
ncbi:MAG: NADH:ubiquinone reductase (Na(+)-transporting) subunit C [Acidobacteria bacterium]|nr:NADH:ubiquinone reductase (Na(+)-transporting) subunit C [Acidobacteriota bacterium]